MALTTYRKKRVFSRTSEPKGSVKQDKSAGLNRFVVHKHSARRLHYDLRLEMGGVLKSWAVPKGPSLMALEKRLAVNTEDHPLEYADFEGDIPAGEYGAGDMILWDRGTWESLEEEPLQAYHKGTIKFLLNGKKLKGKWTLVRLKQGDGKNWLLFKDRDEYASDEDILTMEPASVQSGRRIGEWPAFEPVRTRAKKRSKRLKSLPDVAKLPGAVKEAIPKALKPELATSFETPPKGDEWLYEIKYDGYRILSFVDAGKVKLLTRNGYDWTDKFPKLAEEIGNLPIESAILDGELTVPDDRGISNFQLLQNAIQDGREDRFQYFLFDIPFVNGYSLKQTPLSERKKLLARLLDHDNRSRLLYTEHLAGFHDELLKSACALGLEGIIAKDGGSSYEERRTRSWVKVKCFKQQEFVIGGYTEPRGSREKFGALAVGYYRDGELVHAGRVGTGFNDKSLDSLFRKLQPLQTAKSPFVNLKDDETVTWVKPELVAEVAFMNWTDERLLRQASFLGLREDTNPSEIILETPEPAPNLRHEPKMIYSPFIAGVSITHPEKLIYPEQNIRKFDVAAYYEKIAGWMLPHIENRPLVLLRCPGSISKCFFQKHPGEPIPDTIPKFKLEKKESEKTYMYIDDAKSLLTLVQFGVIEFHIMDVGIRHGSMPDRMVFDFDPAPEVKAEVVIAAALNFREFLRELDLESFVKTTGGKGLHLVAPIEPNWDWDTVKEVSALLTETFAARWPDYIISTMSKAARKGKIFIDYFRNTPGAAWAAPYTLRARPGAAVSMPLRWNEVALLQKFDQTTLLNVEERMKTVKNDPWKDIFNVRQKISALQIRSLKRG